MGALSSHSSSGHRYFVTLVDDYTRFTWVFLLKQNSELLLIIPKSFKMVLTQFDKKVKQLRSDNAKELAFTDFLMMRMSINFLCWSSTTELNCWKKTSTLTKCCTCLFSIPYANQILDGVHINLSDQQNSFTFDQEPDTLWTPIPEAWWLFFTFVYLVVFCIHITFSSNKTSTSCTAMCLFRLSFWNESL